MKAGARKRGRRFRLLVSVRRGGAWAPRVERLVTAPSLLRALAESLRDPQLTGASLSIVERLP